MIDTRATIDTRPMIDTSRFELSWSRSGVRWITIKDRRTGSKAIGHDNESWDVAMARAVAQMRSLTSGVIR